MTLFNEFTLGNIHFKATVFLGGRMTENFAVMTLSRKNLFIFSSRFISESRAMRKTGGKVRESDCFAHAAKDRSSNSKQHLQINFPLHSKHTPAPLYRLTGRAAEGNNCHLFPESCEIQCQWTKCAVLDRYSLYT
jgi:hypothetical protein